MTEAEWLTSANPIPMLEHLKGIASERKLRLIGCSVCRIIWRLLTDQCQTAIEVVERFADGLASYEDMATAHKTSSDVRDFATGTASNIPRRLQTRAVRCTSWAAYNLTIAEDDSRYSSYVWHHINEATEYALDAKRGHIRKNSRLSANLLRDIFGNPFRPVAIDPAWLAWRDGTVAKIARTIYDERRFAELSVLADALEEAGCADRDILDHCRHPGPHVRGYWVVDLVLGKQ